MLGSLQLLLMKYGVRRSTYFPVSCGRVPSALARGASLCPPTLVVKLAHEFVFIPG